MPRMTRPENLQLIRLNLMKNLCFGSYDTYERQTEAIGALAVSDDDAYARGLFDLPTGSGKTHIKMELAKAYLRDNPGGRVIILDESQTQLEQMVGEFRKQFGDDTVGSYYTRQKDTDKPITVSTYSSLGSLNQALGSAAQDVGLLLLDEAHHALTKQREALIEKFGNACHYAFTGSEKYSDDKRLSDHYAVIDKLSIREAIQRGLNCPFKNILLTARVAVDLSGAKSEAAYQEMLEQALTDKRLLGKAIVDFYKNFQDPDTGERSAGRLALVNCHSVAQAEALVQAFNDAFGYEIAKGVHNGQSDKINDAIKAEFQEAGLNLADPERKLRVVCQIKMMSEGYDNPPLALVFNYPTTSEVRETQGSGRAMRVDPNNAGKTAWIVDTVVPHPDYADNSILGALKNNQVLYAHIAGDPVISRGERDETAEREKRQETSGRTRSPPAFGPDLLNYFTVQAETEKLLEIFREAEERFNSSAGRKMEGMYTAGDIVTLLRENGIEISRKTVLKYMSALIKDPERNIFTDDNGEEKPIVIRVRSDGRGGNIPAINIGAKEAFIEAFNLDKRKQNEMLSAEEMREFCAKEHITVGWKTVNDGMQYLLNNPEINTFTDDNGEEKPIVLEVKSPTRAGNISVINRGAEEAFIEASPLRNYKWKGMRAIEEMVKFCREHGIGTERNAVRGYMDALIKDPERNTFTENGKEKNIVIEVKHPAGPGNISVINRGAEEAFIEASPLRNYKREGMRTAVDMVTFCGGYGIKTIWKAVRGYMDALIKDQERNIFTDDNGEEKPIVLEVKHPAGPGNISVINRGAEEAFIEATPLSNYRREGMLSAKDVVKLCGKNDIKTGKRKVYDQMRALLDDPERNIFTDEKGDKKPIVIEVVWREFRDKIPVINNGAKGVFIEKFLEKRNAPSEEKSVYDSGAALQPKATGAREKRGKVSPPRGIKQRDEGR
ncbi:hypothetical protein FACS1894186_2370 [Alphaproteobacteria bacterium]|nr:hypothetical protein FACS1894186_2370 [Alphaproteobacteria bacterium]